MTGPVASFRSFEDRAVDVGAWCWTERRLFEVVGGWVATTDDAALCRSFAVSSRRHAWRAGQLAELLPPAYTAPPEDLVAPPAEADVVDALAALDGTVERAAALYRVVHPRLLVTYATCGTSAPTVTDGPLLRTLRVVEEDLRHDWLEGETSLQRTLRGTEDVDRMVQVLEGLEKGLVKAHLSGNRRPAFGR